MSDTMSDLKAPIKKNTNIKNYPDLVEAASKCKGIKDGESLVLLLNELRVLRCYADPEKDAAASLKGCKTVTFILKEGEMVKRIAAIYNPDEYSEEAVEELLLEGKAKSDNIIQVAKDSLALAKFK